ncbi:flagellar biosynthesis protein FliQ [Tardiphaga sp. 20_F10_N6_6]|jgi:flagellar biosynthetic protein FliQ|uniref:flagellar biosynthesis protein FliQ n=1 Tax=unclassified Tardiphaga TaxID=2631404 RepID=UPI000B75F20A|nr:MULTISPECIES: flagellar biosynthesis protein FliQ [unclassified Tardiphaga]UFS75463.1 flagellar biosynthetic protein FliQ [Tardiphaga sp. 37S4]WPO42047.1 flagellar biosynthesis protein FliQ [Tardiphaga sp. 42S5]SNS54164.1 flagellar biosynthetic protein FliQ [Tardiphaga sp. OK246]
MNERDALDIAQQAIWTIIVAAGPAVGSAMFVGIVIALLQALTQVQEMTLTFIPKIVVMLIVVAVTGSFMGAHIFAFTEVLYGRIERGF